MTDESFQREFLNAHNAYRASHRAPPMTLSGELTTSSQQWANHLLAQGRLEHSSTSNGENVFFMCSSTGLQLTGKEAVDAWYNEVKDYDFNTPQFRNNTGHFTQVVWKSSTELGVGMATDGQKVFVVGQYRPAGNISNHGYFQDNVAPKD